MQQGASATLDQAALAVPAGGGEARDYLQLLKPRVMSLVLMTALIGMAVAPGALHPVLAFTAILCIAVGAGAAGALNMWYDADIDARMARTARRPIPAGRLTPGAALGLGAVLSVGSVTLMALAVNYTAAALLAATISFYLFVYTMWLKRRTPQNIVIGGAAGAFPPMIGYAAVTGAVSIESLILFAIIFFWTPPHFWALALFCAKDYANVGVPMLPITHGEAATRSQILVYTLLLAPIAMLPWLLGYASSAYGAVAAVLGALFIRHAWRVWRGVERAERKAFGFSILYLFLIFAALGVDALLGAALS